MSTTDREEAMREMPITDSEDARRAHVLKASDAEMQAMSTRDIEEPS
jgi:hypothetical protein